MKILNNLSKYFAMVFAILVLGSGYTAFAQVEDYTKYQRMFNDGKDTQQHDVLTLLKGEENFSTFVELLEKSGLDAAFEGMGPMTILAPTNEAFEGMSKAQYDELTKEENKFKLNQILQAHILPRKVYAEDFRANQVVKGADGQDLPVETEHDVVIPGEAATVKIGGARIVRSNIEADNGLIHIMSSVIIPGESMAPPKTRN